MQLRSRATKTPGDPPRAPGRETITRSVMTTHGVPTCAPGFGCRRSWAFWVLLAGGVAGCDLPGRPRPADRYVPPREERTFGVLFQRNCAGCHGTDGKLGPAPPLNNKLFLALVPDTELTRVIASGRAGTLMPAFAEAEGGSLAGEQVKVLAEGIKPRWGPVERAPSGAPPYLLAQTEHGSDGSGDRGAASRCLGAPAPRVTAKTVRVAGMAAPQTE